LRFDALNRTLCSSCCFKNHIISFKNHIINFTEQYDLNGIMTCTLTDRLTRPINPTILGMKSAKKEATSTFQSCGADDVIIIKKTSLVSFHKLVRR